MRSAGFNSASTVRAAWRSFRATRCRSTAPPTDFATMNPIRGAAPNPAAPRWPCTTRSGCEDRTPCLTVWLKSADRVIRYRAGSTGVRPVGQAVRERRPLRRRSATMARPARVRIRNRKPWTLARRRLFGWKVRLPLATAVLLVLWQSRAGLTCASRYPDCRFQSSLPNQRGPGHPVAAVSPTFGRLFEGTEVTSAGQTALIRDRASNLSGCGLTVGTRRETC